MNVLVDALAIREGGGVTYLRHMLPALVAADDRYQFSVLLSSQYQHELLRGMPEFIKPVPVDLPAMSLAQRWWFLQTALLKIIQQEAIDLMFTPTEIGTGRASVPHVVFAHNLNIFAPLSTFPDWNGWLRLLSHRLVRHPAAYYTLRHADRVVFVSRAFQEQVQPLLGLHQQKSRVVHHGVNPAFFTADPDGREKVDMWYPQLTHSKYVLAVSSIAPHKNYDTLLSAFARLPKEYQTRMLTLAVAGATSNASVHKVLLRQAHDLGIADRVHFLGRVPYDRLPVLYHHATIFTFPSRLESFGLPLLEAMASGVPIVASQLPAFQELAGPAALYFPVTDIGAFAASMSEVLSSPAVQQDLIGQGWQRAKSFSWQQSAWQMLNIFDEVVRS